MLHILLIASLSSLKVFGQYTGCDYVVRAGDTCFSIGQSLGYSVEEMIAMNQAKCGPQLQPGDLLCLPGSRAGSTLYDARYPNRLASTAYDTVRAPATVYDTARALPATYDTARGLPTTYDNSRYVSNAYDGTVRRPVASNYVIPY